MNYPVLSHTSTRFNTLLSSVVFCDSKVCFNIHATTIKRRSSQSELSSTTLPSSNNSRQGLSFGIGFDLS